jgi:hypothetical protein
MFEGVKGRIFEDPGERGMDRDGGRGGVLPADGREGMVGFVTLT